MVVKIVAGVIAALLVLVVTVGVTLAVAQPLVLSPNQAPWWGIPIFTLAGGVASAIIGGGFLVWNEHRKQESAMTEKDLELHRKTCVKFLVEVIQFSHDIRQFTQTEAAPLLAALYEVQVTADKEVAKLADDLYEEALALKAAEEMLESGRIERADVEKLSRWYRYKQSPYVEALRRTYGISALHELKAPKVPKPDLDNLLSEAIKRDSEEAIS